MHENGNPLQVLLEPVVSGFWGEPKQVGGRVPCRVVRNGDVAKSGYILRRDLPSRYFTEYERDKARVVDGDIILVSSGAYTGNASVVVGEDDGLPVVVSNFVRRLRPKAKVKAGWLFHLIRSDTVQRYVPAHTGGSAIPNLQSSLYAKCRLPHVPDPHVQQRIAEILSTVDEAIEQTGALIAKTQQVKAGLMHDLFTRGVTADGQLRPPREEAPQLYKESPLGWIPKEWELLPLGSVADSLVDGPFGSNLKTAHYIEAEGVRVVRLQNIQEGEYNDADKAWISEAHAVILIRHQVVAGDVLVAALGDDSYPVGRSCCYPDNLPPGINKADCFRLRSKSGRASNVFVSGFLNTDRARAQIRRYEQGVTRQRINLGNLRRVMITLPSLHEQLASEKALARVSSQHSALLIELSKLDRIKRGLMHDLLTGRVPVTVPVEPGVAEVAASV